MNDGFETDDGEETAGDGDNSNQDQDGGLEHPCDGAGTFGRHDSCRLKVFTSIHSMVDSMDGVRSVTRVAE